MPPRKLIVVRRGRSPLSRHHPYKHHRLVCTTQRAPTRLDVDSPQPGGVAVQNSPAGAATASDARKEDEDRRPTPSPPAPAPTVTPTPVCPAASGDLTTPAIVGDKYLLLDQVEGSTLYRCVDIHTREEYVAKVLSPEAGRVMVNAHLRMSPHPHVSPLSEVVWGGGGDGGEEAAVPPRVYLLLPPAPGGDLHSHVRSRRRLKESEARRLFRQMAAAVRDCHHSGVVLRDLKLRKFVFADKHRTHLRLESLEDAVVIGEGEAAPRSVDFSSYSPAFPSSYTCPGAWDAEEEPQLDDRLEEKRGCPAYVSPEILRSGEKYSGRAADMWSLGVVLYTMLVGRYPFNDSEHASLFAKISRGRFGLPESMSPRARCLVRSLLRRDPKERLSAADVLLHPWLAPCVDGKAREEDEEEEVDGPGAETKVLRRLASPRNGRDRDQTVPDWTGGD
ncbi:tribbles homolog 2-like [Hetaerina americana]|uniref:tribbles homolog 2-like n=1 Tax=Hetaerina americana TaxID=62018 RepID=UPI003A7F1B50